jgi:hypothetical protein
MLWAFEMLDAPNGEAVRGGEKSVLVWGFLVSQFWTPLPSSLLTKQINTLLNTDAHTHTHTHTHAHTHTYTHTHSLATLSSSAYPLKIATWMIN